ncbi:tRNA pseudouridine(38-40) synthase TruA [Paenibacillus lutrae]|uniref:tRNA pseudouridine synthase A n=1 Tax=Paenibacillus lutrae TaxID=2078573 RepID=A0A7X3K1K6_9BACL|nr:tRNA pseudouridine(38-40) synthase TruA [Paenibacillus lutrae]
MRNIRLTVSYDGTSYSGFQTQPHGKTVQDHLERAIWMLSGETVKITSSGRTDAGVHARAQVINFTTASQIPAERWCLALNSRLPKDIVALCADEVPLSFHSRRSAKRKTYTYTIRIARMPDVFNRRYQYHHHSPLNVEAMRDALAAIIGQHDFSSFCSIRTVTESRIRTIYDAWIDEEPDLMSGGAEGTGQLKFYFCGNGFLYNMVRILVGTLIQVGEGKRSADDMAAILRGRNRALAGPTAVAQGLMLWNVEYAD